MSIRHPIPDLARDLKPFTNTSGTLRAVEHPSIEAIKVYRHFLNYDESSRLWIDSIESGIRYIVLSYNVPILWITESGWIYRTDRDLSQTSEKHLGLLYHLPAGHDERLASENMDRPPEG